MKWKKFKSTLVDEKPVKKIIETHTQQIPFKFYAMRLEFLMLKLAFGFSPTSNNT